MASLRFALVVVNTAGPDLQEEVEEEVVTPAEPAEDVDDDLVGGAFAAKERNRIGDFDFAEHPLERRANEAFHNDCKVHKRVY